MNSLKFLGIFVEFLNLWCYFSAILLNCKFVSVPCGCVGMVHNYAQSFCSKNHSGHSIICDIVVMKIARWSNFDCRQLMSSSMMIKETQRKCTNISNNALGLFNSPCEECQKKRKRSRAKGVVIRTFRGKSLHQEDRLISLICSPCQGTTTNRSR